jgi:hypothetical protein
MVIDAFQATDPPGAFMSLFLDLSQGVGLAGATGVRPFLPPLLAGALARGNLGLDFEGTSFAFLEQPLFLLAVLALAVAAYALERRGASRRGPSEKSGRSPLELGLLGLAVLLGALLFAGSLADGGAPAWPGLVAGLACAALGFLAVSGLLTRARRRLDAGAAALLPVYADTLALVLAGLAVLVPPVSFLAIALFVVIVVRGRRGDQSKFEGLRILR